MEENTVKAILCDRRGRLWFGTWDGLIQYRPRQTPPGLVIRRVVEGRLLDAPGSLSYPEGASELVLHFQGLQFRTGGAGPMTYSHRLVGHGPAEEWSEFRPESKVAYRGLPAGECRFEVRARNWDDLVSETAGLQVRVVPGGKVARRPGPADERAASVPSESSLGPTLSGCFAQLGQVVRTDMTLLLAGETGTGKSLLAGEIHARSPRREQPFIRLSCGALPRGLVERELFGHEQGVSGAATWQSSCLQRAHGGTLLLDGIGDLPMEAQRGLLHVLEDGRVRRVGGSEPFRVDVRVIAETNGDLERAVREGTFRQDLYYRLKQFPLQLPPLRDRWEEIPVLAAHFAVRFAGDLKRPVPNLSNEAMTHLQTHSWPGNVRELEHLIRRAVVLCEGEVIEVSDLPLPADEAVFVQAAPPPEGKDERQQLLEALRTCNWIVYGDRGAARLLGMHPGEAAIPHVQIRTAPPRSHRPDTRPARARRGSEAAAGTACRRIQGQPGGGLGLVAVAGRLGRGGGDPEGTRTPENLKNMHGGGAFDPDAGRAGTRPDGNPPHGHPRLATWPPARTHAHSPAPSRRRVRPHHATRSPISPHPWPTHPTTTPTSPVRATHSAPSMHPHPLQAPQLCAQRGVGPRMGTRAAARRGAWPSAPLVTSHNRR